MTIPETPIKEWDELEPHYQELTSRPLNGRTAYQFLLDWSDRCEANVALEADHSDLANEFSRVTGNNLAEYNGEKLTIPQIQEKLRDPDRSVREGVWRAWQQAKLNIAPALDELFLKMLGLRNERLVWSAAAQAQERTST